MSWTSLLFLYFHTKFDTFWDRQCFVPHLSRSLIYRLRSVSGLIGGTEPRQKHSGRVGVASGMLRSFLRWGEGCLAVRDHRSKKRQRDECERGKGKLRKTSVLCLHRKQQQPSTKTVGMRLLGDGPGWLQRPGGSFLFGGDQHQSVELWIYCGFAFPVNFLLHGWIPREFRGPWSLALGQQGSPAISWTAQDLIPTQVQLWQGGHFF